MTNSLVMRDSERASERATVFQLKYIDAAYCILCTTLVAAMNTVKGGPVRYAILMVYAMLWSLCVFPRVISALKGMARFTVGGFSLPSAIFALLGLLTAIAYVRSLSVPELTAYLVPSGAFFVSVWVYAIVVVRRMALQGQTLLLRAIIYSGHLYVALNLVGYLLGLRGQVEVMNDGYYGEARVLGMLGIHSERLLFPLAPGLTSFGLIAGGSLCVAVVGFIKSRGLERTANFLMIPAATAAILFSDARGSLLAVLIVACLLGIPLFANRMLWARYIIIPGSLLFVLLLVVEALLLQAGVGGDLARGNLLLSGREVVWLSALVGALERPAMAIVGYGYMGHYNSGVSANYAYLFQNWNLGDDRVEFYTLHNSFIQQIFDSGVIGYLVLVAVLAIGVGRLGRITGRSAGIAAMAITYLIYLTIASASEVALNVYSFISYVPGVLVMCYACHWSGSRLDLAESAGSSASDN